MNTISIFVNNFLKIVIRLLKSIIKILFIIICLYPLLLIILISLYPNNELSNGISIIPILKLNFQNYIIKDFNILYSIGFTLIISLISSFVIILISFISGFFISRNRNTFFNFPLVVAILIYSIPSIFYATYWNTNSLIPLQFIFSHFNYLFPFVLLITVNYFKYVPFAFDRQAAMDGLSTNYFVRHIIFPYFKPVLYFLFLLVFIIIFNDVLFSTFIANKEEYRFIGHYLIEHYYNPDQSFYKYGELSAFGTIIIFVLSIISFFIIRKYQQHIVKELKNNI